MEAILSTIIPLMPSAAIPLVVCVIFYIYIQSKRKSTKAERDADSADIHDAILKMQFDISTLKDDRALARTVQDDIQKQINQLTTAVAKLSISVQNFSDAVKDLRDDIKELRK